MIFTPTELEGVYLVEPERLEDQRGFFARSWCEKKFKERGLATRLVQCSISFNNRRGTLRGMHYQAAPHEESKLVRCTKGAIHDVIIDLRPGSPTLAQWTAAELTAANRLMLYVPDGCAHGFQTLSDDTEVFYQMSEFHHPQSARGVRFDDPAFGVRWPLAVTAISQKDQGYPDFSP